MATEQMEKILRRTHKLKDATDTQEADADDFNIRSQEELSCMMKDTSRHSPKTVRYVQAQPEDCHI